MPVVAAEYEAAGGDCNENGVLDECEPDTDGDAAIDVGKWAGPYRVVLAIRSLPRPRGPWTSPVNGLDHLTTKTAHKRE